MNPAERYAAFATKHPMETFPLNGFAWEVIVAGRGPTLLLLPGGFGIAATSFEYIQDFARDHQVLALSFPRELNRIAELADGVAAILDRYCITQAHVLGGSAGGAVAQVLVRRHPQRVASLILAQTGPPQPERVSLARRCAYLCRRLPSALTLALLRLAVLGFLPQSNADHSFWRGHFATVIAGQSRAGLAAKFAALADYDGSYHFQPTDLADWYGHVAIIEASNDGFIPSSQQISLRALYPQAHVYRLEGGRHADSVSDSAVQRALIRRILTP